MRMIVASLLLLQVSAAAQASSPKAWAELQRRTERACIQASGLGRPRVSNPVIFDDRTGAVALLVSGTEGRAGAGGIPVTKLCLYNRRNGTVALEEAKGWGERR
ncbi:MAG TPA: hypothetical protein VF662_05000 [Allosphingosinicella sp.]